MYIVLGLNHKTAPISVREKVSFSGDRMKRALSALKQSGVIEESVILSTCNRTEFHIVTSDTDKGLESLWGFIADTAQAAQDDIERFFYLSRNKDALRHLFRVSSSLDSMIVGETQVLGQVKDAYFKARECGAVGKKLDEIFEEAIRVGKRVRTRTQIGKGAVSTSTAAIELARKIFDTLENKQVLIIGAGKIGEVTVRNLFSRGIRTVVVANRTFDKARELAGEFGGTAVTFEQAPAFVAEADIVISSTSAPHYVLALKDVEDVMRRRRGKPLLFIDLGMPRNIDPDINTLENVYVYNVDDLASVRDANIRERKIEASKAEEIVLACVNNVCARLGLDTPGKTCVEV
jgi:glutamyl-tRNA reductase